MAKTCTVCHQTYPEHFTACPHCAKKREEDSSVIRLHDPSRTRDWTDSPSSSSDERRGDVISIDPIAEGPHGSSEDSSIEILPEESAGKPAKKKTHLVPKGRDTKLVSMPTDEADIGQEPAKPSDRPTPKTMIAPPTRGEAMSGQDSSLEINLEEKKSGSSLEMGKGKKAGSSSASRSDSSLEIGKEKKSGSSVEFGKEKKSGSSVEMSLEDKPGSSVEMALEKKGGSSMEIHLPDKKDDDSPSASLLLGGPGSDVGSGKPSSDQLRIGDKTRGADSSAVDLGSSPEVRMEEEEEAMTSDSAVVAEAPAIRQPGNRPAKKSGAGLGLLIGGGVGVLAASLLWIFGPLDGLRGSLRETVGLSAEKKTQVTSAIRQQGLEAPVAHKEEPSKSDNELEKPPAPAAVNPPAATNPPAKEEPVASKPAPAPAAEKAEAEKSPDLLAQVAPAIKLAKEQKYQEAAAMLQKVRGAGTAADETFARFCDELLASWQLKEKLGTAGDPARKNDPLSALDSLLKDKKDASSAVTAAMEKIKSADPKTESLSQGIDSLLGAAKKADEQAKKSEEQAKKAEEQVKTTQAGLKKLEKEKEEAQVALTATADLLKAGNYLDTQSPNPAQGVEKLLADKKSSDAQAHQANAKLKEAEETIQDMTQKLVEAKYLKPGEKPVRTTRAPSQGADLTLAEKYYLSGVSHYWGSDYAAAEKDLAKAIGYFKDDARFYYYFGLACWGQGKRDQANEAFQKGTELESRSRPSSAQINATLERIQGAARATIDQAREHPQPTSTER